LTFFCKGFRKESCFLVSSGKNELSPLPAPFWKNLFATAGKIRYLPPLEKVLPTPMLLSTKRLQLKQKTASKPKPSLP